VNEQRISRKRKQNSEKRMNLNLTLARLQSHNLFKSTDDSKRLFNKARTGVNGNTTANIVIYPNCKKEKNTDDNEGEEKEIAKQRT
jgi:hypothetical protein